VLCPDAATRKATPATLTAPGSRDGNHPHVTRLPMKSRTVPPKTQEPAMRNSACNRDEAHPGAFRVWGPSSSPQSCSRSCQLPSPPQQVIKLRPPVFRGHCGQTGRAWRSPPRGKVTAEGRTQWTWLRAERPAWCYACWSASPRHVGTKGTRHDGGPHLGGPTVSRVRRL